MFGIVVLTLIASGLVAALLLAAPASLFQDAPEADLPRDRAVSLVLLAIVLRLAIQLVLGRNGLLLCSMDEPIRWDIAYGWSQNPFWFTFWDGIWLTGHFAFWGTLIKLIPPTLIGLQLGVIGCHVLTIIAAGYLTYVVGGKRWLGALAALLVALSYPFFWMGQGTLAETLLAGCFMIGLAWTWRFCEHFGRSPLRQWAYALGGGFFILATTSLHYIGWMAVLVGVPFFLGALWLRRRQASPSAVLAAGLILLLAAAFPLMWIYGSWHFLGSPFQFLTNQAQMNVITNGAVSEQKDLLKKMLIYPKALAKQIGILLPLGLLALRLVWRGALAKRVLILGGYIAALLGLMITSGLSGGYPLTFFRSTIIIYTLLLCLLALGLYPSVHLWKEGSMRSWHRYLTLGALLLMFAGWLGFNGLMGNRLENSVAEDMPHDIIALGAWLQQEVRRPQMLDAFNPASRIGVHCPNYQNEWTSYFRYTAGCPERIVSIPPEQWQKNELAGYQYLFVQAGEAPAGWQPLAHFGVWSVLRPGTP